MIRVVLFLFVLFLSIQSLSAQRDRGALTVGYSINRFSIEEVTGSSLHATFSKTFYNPLIIGLNGTYGFVSQMDSLLGEQKLRTFSTGLELGYAFVNNEMQQFRAGAGISGRFFDDQWSLDDSRQINKSAFKPGLSLHIVYDLILRGDWLVGGRASLQRFAQENTVYLAGIHFGKKF